MLGSIAISAFTGDLLHVAITLIKGRTKKRSAPLRLPLYRLTCKRLGVVLYQRLCDNHSNPTQGFDVFKMPSDRGKRRAVYNCEACGAKPQK